MLKKLFPFAVIVSLLWSSASQPSAAANREHQQLMADIRMLQEQNQQLHAMIGLLTDSLKAVAGRLDDQSGTNRKAFADQKLLVDNVSGDIRIVREKVDETNVRISSMLQEVEALRLVIPQMPTTSLPQPDAPPAAPGDPAAPAPSGTAPPAVLAPGMSPTKLYEMAWADYAAGQWTIAIQGFESYIKTFPKSEQADDAQLYIGEANFFDGKFTEAVDAYNRVIVNYPASNSVPQAYLKRGLALERLDQDARARESYEFVVKNHPDSDAGRIAKQYLDRLLRKPARD